MDCRYLGVNQEIAFIELIIERTQMGAFWNPNDGIMLSGRRLSKEEMTILKRKWSEHAQFSTSPAQYWWRRIKMIASILFS
jgi:hypothetical protein